MADGGNVIFKFLGDDSALTGTLKKVGNIGVTAMKALAGATAAVGAGVAGIVTASVNARSEMEQTLGGVQTIFKDGANTIVEQANKAYKEAGISAQQYMDQAVSFGASLRRSLGDNDAEVAKYVDMAIKDMADNSAKIGTSLESIQNAYQGLAKGNATMLDNLKVGYGGTQTEMLKLAKDMGVIGKNVKSFNDVSFDQAILAIHKVQEQLGMTNTAAEEAKTTMAGSVQAMKAAWQNFLSGTGNMGEVVETARTAFQNVKRILDEALPYITENLREWMPEILNLVGEVLGSIGNAILENLPVILNMVGDALTAIGTAIYEHREEVAQVVGQLMLIVGRAIWSAIPYVLYNIHTMRQKAMVDITTAAVEWGTKLLNTFAKAIYDNLFQVVSSLLEMKNKIVEKYTEMKNAALRYAAEMIANFVIGVANKINSVRAKIDEIKTTIRNKFYELINSAANWGRDMINGFTNGVNERLGALRQHVENVANAIRSRLHFSRPDEGPLRDYETWLPDMIKGMANSLDKASPFLIGKVNDLASAMNMSPTLNGNVNNNLSPNMNVVVNNQMEIDPLGQVVNQIKTFSNGAKNDYNYGYGG